MGFFQWSRRKKIIALALSVLTILYFFIGVFLIVDIQLMETPHTTVTIDILELTADEALIFTNITMENPNGYPFIAKDFNVLLSTSEGITVGELHLDGGAIAGHSTESFETTSALSFQGEPVTTLKVDISSRIGATFLGLFTKTLPLEITLITPLEKIIHDIQVPEIHINADLTDITQEGVTIAASVDVTNPNGFDLSLEDVVITFSNDEGASVGSLQINDVLIPGDDDVTIDITGFIDLSALNADVLEMSLSGTADLSLAGIDKSLSLSTSADIHMPDLNSLLSHSSPTDLVMRVDFRATFKGLLSNITIEIVNPNKIDIQAEDITISVYRVDREDETFITRVELDGGIAEANDSFLTQSDLLIPYRSLFHVPGHFGLPDWLCVRVYANLSIPGIDASLWVGVCEYQDMHLIR